MCSPWGHKELDTTWQLNNNNKNEWFHVFSFPKKNSFLILFLSTLGLCCGGWASHCSGAQVRGQAGTVVVV